MIQREEAVRIMIDKFSGTIAPEDEVRLRAWLESSDLNRQFYRDAMNVWVMSPEKRKHPSPDSEQEWDKVSTRIQSQTVHFDRRHVWYAAAAAVSLLLVAGIFKYRQSSPVILSASETPLTFLLPDSSKIVLGEHSSLTYADDFNQKHRQVHLTGDASFLVTHRTAPFIVQTQYAQIRVLGTEFNVDTNDSAAVVSVTRGNVNVSNSNATINLSGGERTTAKHLGELTKENLSKLYQASLERANPSDYIRIENTNRKTLLNATVAEGILTNTAITTSYENITLSISYKKSNGSSVQLVTKVQGVLAPGGKLSFRKKLGDLFSKKHPVNIKILTAEPKK
ncbi:MAG TPA: FecR family protein [Chryseosolibacter sp.]